MKILLSCRTELIWVSIFCNDGIKLSDTEWYTFLTVDYYRFTRYEVLYLARRVCANMLEMPAVFTFSVKVFYCEF